jgi:hypothetical protein
MTKPKEKEKYQHWKGENHIYEIITVANVNGEKIVFYKSLYSDENVYVGQPFSRPLKEFCGYKEIDGEKVKRFTKLEEKVINA